MWRGLLLCLAIAAGDDAAVDSSGSMADSEVPQQLMSAEQLRRIHQAVDKNKDGKAGTAGTDVWMGPNLLTLYHTCRNANYFGCSPGCQGFDPEPCEL